MQQWLVAVINRFPAQEGLIKRSVLADEAFRSLCEDFADAEFALHKWGDSLSQSREARLREYRELVDELATEIERSLENKDATGI